MVVVGSSCTPMVVDTLGGLTVVDGSSTSITLVVVVDVVVGTERTGGNTWTTKASQIAANA